MSNMKNNASIVVEEGEDTWVTNWPPRSYSCTFCRREFRSAQALGGHMNVHRRERARASLHHHHHNNNHHHNHNQSNIQTQVGSTTTTSPTSLFYQLAATSSRYTNYNINEISQEVVKIDNDEEDEDEAPIEELDLELRLGHIPPEKLFEKNNTNVSVLNFR